MHAWNTRKQKNIKPTMRRHIRKILVEYTERKASQGKQKDELIRKINKIRTAENGATLIENYETQQRHI